MPKKKISLFQLKQLVMEGYGVCEIAHKLGVTKGAVSKALKRLNIAVTKDVALRTATKIADKKIDAMGQLTKVNNLINDELDYVQNIIKTSSGTERKELQAQQLKHVAEVRKQLGLLLNIAEALYNAEEVAAFQQIVLEEVGNAAPEVRDKILHRLNERRAIRSTLDFSKHRI
jgi:hypothetical protein